MLQCYIHHERIEEDPFVVMLYPTVMQLWLVYYIVSLTPHTHCNLVGISAVLIYPIKKIEVQEGWKMFHLMMHSTHFILRTTQIVREETCCCNMGYSFRLTARVLLYAPSHRQDSTYHSLCYTSCGSLAGTEIPQWVHPMKDQSDNPSHHERTLLTQSYISLPRGTVSWPYKWMPSLKYPY